MPVVGFGHAGRSGGLDLLDTQRQMARPNRPILCAWLAAKRMRAGDEKIRLATMQLTTTESCEIGL